MSRNERTPTHGRRALGMRLVASLLLASIGASAQEDQAARVREPALRGPFPARITRVIEGDHFEIDFDFGPIIRGQQRLRLANANTPSPFSDRECEARLGLEVVGLVRELVRPQQLWVRDFRLGRNGFERVGRVLVSNKRHRLEQVDLGEYLIVLGLALPYDDSRWNPDRRVWVCDEPSESR